MRHEFSEVLNDLVDCFLVGDLLLLKRFKEQHGLPEDVASALTTSDSGDRAVLEGVVVPLVGIENHPYTVIFTLDGDTPELLKTEAAFSIGAAGTSCASNIVWSCSTRGGFSNASTTRRSTHCSRVTGNRADP